MANLMIWTVNLDHSDAWARGPAGQASPVRAGAFHSEPLDEAQALGARAITLSSPARSASKCSTHSRPPIASRAAAA